MAQELKNVTWPTVDQLKTYCVIVLVFIAFMAIVIGFFDLGASTLVRAVRPS
jgi:preprotein translocase SecE subunit